MRKYFKDDRGAEKAREFVVKKIMNMSCSDIERFSRDIPEFMLFFILIYFERASAKKTQIKFNLISKYKVSRAKRKMKQNVP